METDGGDPSTVNKNPKVIKGAQEEVSKLDVLVCGVCRHVFHFIEEFKEHKEKPCTNSSFSTNISETKPQVWAFLLWKSAIVNKQKSEGETGNVNSWKMYQRWLKMEDDIRDSWVAAGKAIQCYAMIANAKLQEVHRVPNETKPKVTILKQDSETKENVKGHTEIKSKESGSEAINKNNLDKDVKGTSNQDGDAGEGKVEGDQRLPVPGLEGDDSIEIKEEKLSEEECSEGALPDNDDLEDTMAVITSQAPEQVVVKKHLETRPDSNRVPRRPLHRTAEGISEDEYVVEKILAKRFNPKKKYFEYLLKWEGYPNDQNTWEPVHNMAACDKLVETFERNLARQKAQQQQQQQQRLAAAGVGPKLMGRMVKPGTPLAGAGAGLAGKSDSTPGPSPGPSGVDSSRPVRSSKKKAMEQVKTWCGSMAKTTEFGKRKVGESSDSEDEDDPPEKRIKLEPGDDDDWSSGELAGSQASSGDEAGQSRMLGMMHKGKDMLSPFSKRTPGRPRKLRPDEVAAGSTVNGMKARKPDDANDLAVKLGLESDSSPESKVRSQTVTAVSGAMPGQPPVLVANSKGVIKVDPRQVPNLTSGVYIVANKSNMVKLETVVGSPTKNKVLAVKQSPGDGAKASTTLGVVHRKIAPAPPRPAVPGQAAVKQVLQKPGTPGRAPTQLGPGLVKVSPQLGARPAGPGQPLRVLGPRPALGPRATTGSLLQSPRPIRPGLTTTTTVVKRPITMPGVQTKIMGAVRPRAPVTSAARVLSPLSQQTKSGVRPIQAMLGKAVQGQAVTVTTHSPLLAAKKVEGIAKPGGVVLRQEAGRGSGRGRGRGEVVAVVGATRSVVAPGAGRGSVEKQAVESETLHMEFHEELSDSDSGDSLPELPMGDLPALEPDSPPRPFTLCPETGKILSRAEGEPTPPPSPPRAPTPPPEVAAVPQPGGEEGQEILPDRPAATPPQIAYTERGETLLKVEMSPGGTTGTVIESNVGGTRYVDSMRTEQGLTVTKIPGAATTAAASAAATSTASTVAAKTAAAAGPGASSGISVPARKLFLDAGGGKLGQEVVTVTGDDGVVYQIATEGQEEMEGAEGLQQCVYVTTGEGEGGEEGAVLTLDTAVAEAVAQLMPDQVIGGSQFYIKEGDGTEGAGAAGAAATAGALDGAGTEQLVMVEQGGEDGSQAQVVAHVVQEGEIIPGTGKRRVVLLLPDGNLMMTDVDEEQYAALNLDK